MDEASNETTSLSPLLYADDDNYYQLDEEGCDESRCVSKGRSDLHNFSFTCYGNDGPLLPRMCADGFLPVVVDDEPAQVSATWYMERNILGQWISRGDVPVRFFTCCPPQHSAVVAGATVARRCSDPMHESDAGTAAAVCGDYGNDSEIAAPARVHPRWMIPTLEGRGVTRGETVINPVANNSEEIRIPLKGSFLCCDEPPSLETGDDSNGDRSNRTTYIDDTQCVPYRNDLYHASRITPNRVGQHSWVNYMFCDLPGFPVVSSFSSPRGGIHPYRCCRDGPAIRSIYIRDSAFWITFGLPFPLQVVAVVLSLVVFLGLLIPLLKQLTNRTHRMASSQARNRQSYSPYNLYLVHLAFWDLISHAALAVNFGMTFTGKYRFYDTIGRIYLSYSFANIWINAFIVHQVLVLLKRSRETPRIVPLSLTRVNMECAGASAIALAYGFVFVDDSPIILVLAFLPPILYIMWAAALIRKRGYLPSRIRRNASNGANERALRELAIYFFRIIGVFFGIWIPGMVLGFISIAMKWDWFFVPSTCLGAIQPSVTFIVILSKSDCKSYIHDLVTFSCVFGKSTESQQPRQNANFAGPSPQP